MSLHYAFICHLIQCLFLMYAAGSGSENPIPLSPQWLLPKPGESKPGMLTGVCYRNFHDFILICLPLLLRSCGGEVS